MPLEEPISWIINCPDLGSMNKEAWFRERTLESKYPLDTDGFTFVPVGRPNLHTSGKYGTWMCFLTKVSFKGTNVT